MIIIIGSCFFYFLEKDDLDRSGVKRHRAESSSLATRAVLSLGYADAECGGAEESI